MRNPEIAGVRAAGGAPCPVLEQELRRRPAIAWLLDDLAKPWWTTAIARAPHTGRFLTARGHPDGEQVGRCGREFEVCYDRVAQRVWFPKGRHDVLLCDV